MAILKKRTYYEVENVAVVDEGQITGVSPEDYICGKLPNTEREIKLPDKITKVYIDHKVQEQS